MKHEMTLQEIIIRQRLKTGHQTSYRYEHCSHCGVLVMGAHDCPVLNGEGEERLRRVKRFILFVSVEGEKRKAREDGKAREEGEEREKGRGNVKRFGLYRRSA